MVQALGRNEAAQQLRALWEDEAIQQARAKRAELAIGGQNLDFFIEKADIIFHENYLASDNDIFCWKKCHHGITQVY